MTETRQRHLECSAARRNLVLICNELGIDPRLFRCFDARHAAPTLASILHHDLLRYREMPTEPNPQHWSWED